MNVDLLLGEPGGIIREVLPVPSGRGAPSGLSIYSALLSGPQLPASPSDRLGAGAGFDPQRSWLSAVGEAVERYCGNRVTRIDRVASPQCLAAEKVPFLSPDRVRTFLPAQYEEPSFPFVPPTRETEIEWVRGEPLTGGAGPTMLPASLVYLGDYDDDLARRRLPRTHPPVGSGIAAGPSAEAAVTAALLETVERDAVALWWLGRREAPEIAFDHASPLGEQIWEGVDRRAIRLRWLLLPSPFRLPTVACVCVDYEYRTVNVGLATRFDAREALLKATAEAFQLRLTLIMLLQPNSGVWRANAEVECLRPYRRDRAYLDSFRRGWADMVHFEHNLQALLDERTWAHTLRRLRPSGRVPIDEVRQRVGCPDGLVSEFARLRMPVFTVDVTADEVRPAGVQVMRTVVPDCCWVTATAFPTLGNARLMRLAGHPEGTAVGERFDLSPAPFC